MKKKKMFNKGGKEGKKCEIWERMMERKVE